MTFFQRLLLRIFHPEHGRWKIYYWVKGRKYHGSLTFNHIDNYCVLNFDQGDSFGGPYMKGNIGPSDVWIATTDEHSVLSGQYSIRRIEDTIAGVIAFNPSFTLNHAEPVSSISFGGIREL